MIAIGEFFGPDLSCLRFFKGGIILNIPKAVALFRVRTTLLLLIVLMVSMGSTLYPVWERWISAMTQNVVAASTVLSKPPIDMQLPGEVATATFAMG